MALDMQQSDNNISIFTMKLPKALNGGNNEINVIIETPKGSRNKFDFDKKTNLYKLGKILPAGTAFPHHFGFVPNTKGGDGDPVDNGNNGTTNISRKLYRVPRDWNNRSGTERKRRT